MFLVIIVAFDLSALARYITRFTEESFAALISLIFIKGAFVKLFDILYTDPFDKHSDWLINCTCQPANQSGQGIQTDNAYSATIVDWRNNITSKEQCLALDGELVGADCNYADSVFFFSVCLFFGTFVIAMTLKSFKSSRFLPNMVSGISDVTDFSSFVFRTNK